MPSFFIAYNIGFSEQDEHLMKKLLIALSRILIGIVIAIPVVLYPLLYFRQDAMLFMPRPVSTEQAAWIHEHYPDTAFNLTVEVGVTLHGWLRQAEQSGPLLIYFGGNAEEVSHLLDMTLPPQWSLLLMNYRGYGDSTGKPGEAAMFHDALMIYDAVASDFPQIAVMGRSMGTGVATYLASQRPVCGAVLISPYDSVRQLAQDIYPFVPVGWLLKHHFDAESYAPAVTAPVLALIADQDKLVPPIHSARLLQAWGGDTHAHHFPQADHNSVVNEAEFWPVIQHFLDATTTCKGAENTHG
jgi:pimeloyl-ACP methyl ester carboxylesterase